jgi:2-polyprenyl-6-methoxyphenol hydroxylase-like FAD-dependent oxidoreductase
MEGLHKKAKSAKGQQDILDPLGLWTALDNTASYSQQRELADEMETLDKDMEDVQDAFQKCKDSSEQPHFATLADLRTIHQCLVTAVGRKTVLTVMMICCCTAVIPKTIKLNNVTQLWS